MIDIINQNGDIISKKNGFDSNQANLQPYENRAGAQELRLKISSQTEQTGDYIIEYNIQSFSDIEEEVVNLTNKERAKSGLSPLTRNPLLDKAAQRHAEDMDASGRTTLLTSAAMAARLSKESKQLATKPVGMTTAQEACRTQDKKMSPTAKTRQKKLLKVG